MVLRKILKETTLLVAIQAANMLLPLVMIPYLLRSIGTQGFGVMVQSQAIATLAAILTDFGFNLTATKTVAAAEHNRKNISKLYATVTTAKVVLAFLAAIIFTAFATATNLQEEILFGAISASPIIIGSILFPQWLLHGTGRLWLSATIQLISRTICLIATIQFVRTSSDTQLAILLQSLPMMIGGAICLYILLKGKELEYYRPTRFELAQSLKIAAPIFLSNAAITLYTTINPLIIGGILDSKQVGIFATADKIRQAAQTFCLQIGQAAFPRISAMTENNTKSAEKLTTKVFYAQTITSTIAGLALFAFAPELTDLVAGEGSEAAATVLRYLSPLPAIISVSNVLGIQTLIPRGENVMFSRILIVAGIANCGLMYLLTKEMNIVGSAASLIITEIAVSIAMFAAVQYTKNPPLKKAPDDKI